MSSEAPARERIPLLRLPGREARRARRAARRTELEAAVETPQVESPAVDIDPADPVLAYFQAHPGPAEVDHLKLESPGVEALRAAGVRLIVPLVSQGELIGLVQLGERLSEQDYSADDRKLLENLADHAAPALRVAQLVREQEVEVLRRERYEQELKVAQLIQQNFLPRKLPEQRGWRLSAFYRPAREVGGDFYDFIDLPDGRLAVVVGDVTDKGVPAALVMASTRSVIRSAALTHVEPGAVLAAVNDQIQPDMPPNMFVTCLYGVLDPVSGRFVFANAGHNLPCVQTGSGAEEVRATGMPLGLMPGLSYDEAEVTVDPGRAILLYSDALPEAHDVAGEMFGFPRTVEVVGDCGGDGQRLIDRLISELHRFTGEGWEQEDDITLVAVQRAGPNVPAYADDVTGDEAGRELAAFTVASEPGNERIVMERVAEAVDATGVDAGRLERLKTAVAEATMNAIEHGNENRAELPVAIRVVATTDALVVRITDHGGAAPIPDTTEPDIEAKLRGEQSPRGWGLFLIRNMVDELNVIADSTHHTVELVMRLNEGTTDG